MKPEHSPLPWHTRLYESEEGLVGCISDADGAIVSYAPLVDTTFIIRAVNAHEELVECLKRILADGDCYCNNDRSVGLPYTCPIHAAEQAVAKAEGK